MCSAHLTLLWGRQIRKQENLLISKNHPYLRPGWPLTNPSSPLLPETPVAKPDLRWLIRHHHTMSKSVPVIQILSTQISFHPDEMLRGGQT